MAGGLKITDLTLSYHWKKYTRILFRDLNLEIDSGSFVTISGLNGSGKSSLLKLILGLIKPDNGTVRIDDYRVVPGNPEMVQKGLCAYLGQNPDDYFLGDTVQEELLSVPGSNGEDMGKVLEELEISALMHRQISTLSGGERQRLALAIFFMNRANYLLLDEPTSYLDSAGTEYLKRKLKEVHVEGRTILHVTQYPDEVYWGTHQLVLGQDGQEVIFRCL